MVISGFSGAAAPAAAPAANKGKKGKAKSAKAKTEKKAKAKSAKSDKKTAITKKPPLGAEIKNAVAAAMAEFKKKPRKKSKPKADGAKKEGAKKPAVQSADLKALQRAEQILHQPVPKDVSRLQTAHMNLGGWIPVLAMTSTAVATGLAMHYGKAIVASNAIRGGIFLLGGLGAQLSRNRHVSFVGRVAMVVGMFSIVVEGFRRYARMQREMANSAGNGNGGSGNGAGNGNGNGTGNGNGGAGGDSN